MMFLYFRVVIRELRVYLQFWVLLQMENKVQHQLLVFLHYSWTMRGRSKLQVFLLTLPEHLSSPTVFSGGSCNSTFSFMCMFCRLLFVLLFIFFWPLCCLFFFDIRILINPLVSSNSSCKNQWLKTKLVEKYISAICILSD